MNFDKKPIVFGAPYSVYVRAVRLSLEEKGIAYDLFPVDIFAPDGKSAEHLARHPFAKIPAFEHDGFRLYEAGAITRYVDEAFAGPKLQPDDARGRARMTQIISVLDSYAYRTLVWGIYVERIARPATGTPADEAKIAAAIPSARVCLRALADLMGEGPWLCGVALTLADLHAAPMLALFRQAPEGEQLLCGENCLRRWWDQVSALASFARTAFAPQGAALS
jgi:glutathione S-transferase